MSANPPVFDVPCLECGSLPEADWENGDIRVVCSNQRCVLSCIAVTYERWPITATEAKKNCKFEEE